MEARRYLFRVLAATLDNLASVAEVMNGHICPPIHSCRRLFGSETLVLIECEQLAPNDVTDARLS